VEEEKKERPFYYLPHMGGERGLKRREKKKRKEGEVLAILISEEKKGRK